MDSYYDEILKGVHDLIEKEDYKEAFAVLEDELAMPYIPKESETKLIELYNLCRSKLAQENAQKTYDLEDLDKLLQGSIEEQFWAVELLKKSNVRRHLEQVEYALCQDLPLLVRSLLIEILIEQNIATEMHMMDQGMEISFYPCYVEMPMQCQGAIATAQQLCDWFENDDPSFLKLCMESLVKEAYLRLPMNIEADEASMLALAIVEYVYIASQDRCGFETFLKEKKLAQKHGFELLLNRHGS